jgi:hypothetical protein
MAQARQRPNWDPNGSQTLEQWMTDETGRNPGYQLPEGWFVNDEGQVERRQPAWAYRNPWIFPAAGMGIGALASAVAGAPAALAAPSAAPAAAAPTAATTATTAATTGGPLIARSLATGSPGAGNNGLGIGSELPSAGSPYGGPSGGPGVTSFGDTADSPNGNGRRPPSGRNPNDRSGSDGLMDSIGEYGPLVALLIRALTGGMSGGGGDQNVPPELQQMLAEATRRMQATGPLFDQLNAHAKAGLPRQS